MEFVCPIGSKTDLQLASPSLQSENVTGQFKTWLKHGRFDFERRVGATKLGIENVAHDPVVSFGV